MNPLARDLPGLVASVMLPLGIVGLCATVWCSGPNALHACLRRYQDQLDRDLGFLRVAVTGFQVAMAQLFSGLLFAAIAMATERWLFTSLAFIVAVAPAQWLQSQRCRRVNRIEQQLDGWLLSLANALKASASLGEAMASSSVLMHSPIAQEIDLLLKEYRLGTPLDRGLQNMAERIGSRTVASALLTLKVARDTGGDLPTTLETMAASLRELARLEAVARTKTAEGKAQAAVIAVIPFVLFGVLHWIDPEFFRPLIDTGIGHVVVAVAAVLWLAAIALARKILVVDI